MYQEYLYFTREGWICPRCKIILNPSMNFCPYCGMKEQTFATTTAKPEWIYREDTTTGSVLPTMSWQDAVWLEKFRDDC